ncbi:molybdopterin-dependent oxidoreductase [Dokdonella sp.]|uniref:molybdopterin-dependent oxidoreductase n=1 Tax=Dokdonella sp. TaxID=2291710 RepID=UPI001B21EFBD|nr:molybdopterin-dependent oxidoreductase [Dokdonella sp.]MBO9665009.1 molybdopterin-dependent oxidoreductase [Dokdonella sp.]
MTPLTRRFAGFALSLVAWIACGVAQAERAPAGDAPAVALGGEVAKPLRLDAAALAKMKRVAVEADDHGTPGRWEGVRLIDLLRDAGVPTGDTLRGKALALYLRVDAADGYRAVYALAELDAGFRDGEVILADHRDGKPLDAKEGPFRIVATGEKRPARWVRQVVAIDVLRAPEK